MTPNVTTLHLIIPDFFAYAVRSDSSLRLDTLATWLPKSLITPLPYSATANQLFWQLFNFPIETHLPVAPITYLHDYGTVQKDTTYLRADPVYLQADRDKLILFDVFSTHPPSTTETDALLNSLNTFYQPDGLQFYAATPNRWYIRLTQTPALNTTPLLDVIGRDIQAFMPTGTDKRQWCAILNEIQMLLHQHLVNQSRTEQRQPLINSLWFWGLGKLPPPPAPRWQYVWSNDPFVRGLATLSTVSQADVPNSIQSCIQQMTQQTGEYLLNLTPTQETDGSTRLTQIDKEWLLPLYQAVKQGKIQQIHLYFCDERVFSLNRQQIKHWWKWRKPWQTYAQTHFAQLPVSRLD
ncbi:hypothetical protein [Beggiatoa leptomitoformis]|uniref:Phosphoglycerate mutase n=1 Tax=Beggiatoa leptomitoformis TaxID=288004 RepID=A0A2N9YB76_9GAMM|nr:hypothetical protein [Beggiatoa leptomitoformis]AUI67725.1 hypothetical protein BLE401_02785 [Beggiatoa leptomitoformis]QGX03516.1 hypothetical protein AL038_18420 [Beggiatoa leptomitoformis]